LASAAEATSNGKKVFLHPSTYTLSGRHSRCPCVMTRKTCLLWESIRLKAKNVNFPRKIEATNVKRRTWAGALLRRHVRRGGMRSDLYKKAGQSGGGTSDRPREKKIYYWKFRKVNQAIGRRGICHLARRKMRYAYTSNDLF